VDLLLTDPRSGKKTGLAATVRRTLRALAKARIPHCVVGATALAVRGFPRMTRDLDVVVLTDDAQNAWKALKRAALRASTPTGTPEDPEPMVVFVDVKTGVEVDLLVAAGDPEAAIVDGAPSASVFGVKAPVATLEHLLLMYLYSNQPKHIGDFATIIQSGQADLMQVERVLRWMHPEMLRTWKHRVRKAKSPPPAPSRPPRRRR
jgi:hypothetical protein